MILNILKNFVNPKPNYNHNNQYPKPKILENEYDEIYDTLINRLRDEYFLEEQIKNAEERNKKYIKNIEKYSSFLKFTINNKTPYIIDKEKFNQFLIFSSYYSTAEDIIKITIKRLLDTYYNNIIELQIKINSFKENSFFFETYNPFNEYEDIYLFLNNEILDNLQISHSFTGSIHFCLNDFYGIIMNYFLKHTLKIREKHEDFHKNKEIIILEKSRVKLIYERHKKYKEFNFLKEYTDKFRGDN